MVMEQNRSTIRIDGIDVGVGQSTYKNNKDSGRYLPVFNSKVSTFMANAFLKYKGIEGFLPMNLPAVDLGLSRVTQIAIGHKLEPSWFIVSLPMNNVLWEEDMYLQVADLFLVNQM